MIKKNNLTISVIIPAYNEEWYILDCLEHILQQASLINEIIVVDNASTDRTSAIVAMIPGVKLVHEPAQWLVKARHTWYLESTSDIIAYLDADTRMSKGRIQKVLQTFETHEELVFISWPYHYYDLPVRKQIGQDIYRKVLAQISYFIMWYIWVWGNMAMKRDMISKIGWFDTSIEFYGEDTNLARRASHVGKCIFDQRLIMPTSARRFQFQWTYKTVYLYCSNFLSEVLIHRPHTTTHKDFR